MLEVNNTGERILLEKETPLMIARHFCAYKFTKGYILQKKVLDIGCGEGYGSHYLAEFAKDVIGIDYDRAVIDYAKDKYKKENLVFSVFDVENLDSLNQKFDVVLAFQFIEHVRDPEKLLVDIKNLLSPEGLFICSTPNKKDASPHSDTPLNKFHLKEYLCEEFKELLEKEFQDVEMYGLKRGKKLNFYRRMKKIGLFNFLPPAKNPVQKFYARIDFTNFVIVRDKLQTALDFIAVCKK